MAASSSTAAWSNNNQWYEVFISHRGVDTKKTFARSLYLRLIERGLRAFLDEDEMQPGYKISSQLKDVIRTASVHVAILSVRYAESYWCLTELLQMLGSGAPVIPVFYGVTPAEVRWTRGKSGKYAQALQMLAEKKTYDPQTREEKMRYDTSVIENWRNALTKVADLSGFELEEHNIGEEVEVELVERVVKCLWEKLKRPDLHVARFPTGLDEKVKDFEDTILLQQRPSGRYFQEDTGLLQQRPSGKDLKGKEQLQQRPSEGTRILGIWGLGGIGKTTLAEEFFNRKKSEYHRSCFLDNIKDNAEKGDLNSLQRQLFKSLTLKEPVESVDKGEEMLKEPLKSSNALMILDDVDDVDQVNALLPVEIHDLHSYSLVLITSRDKQVLINSGVRNSSIYKLIGLDPDHSRVLFCSYAFSQPYPLLGFEYLVDRFLKACKGLPLSLKVFGALLYGRDKSEWEDELEGLEQILNVKIYKTLNIFLDIACYFIGTNRDTAIGIWNRCGWRGKRGFQNLQNKCLVELDSWNRIDMHDHVRD